MNFCMFCLTFFAHLIDFCKLAIKLERSWLLMSTYSFSRKIREELSLMISALPSVVMPTSAAWIATRSFIFVEKSAIKCFACELFPVFSISLIRSNTDLISSILSNSSYAFRSSTIKCVTLSFQAAHLRIAAFDRGALYTESFKLGSTIEGG